MIVFYLVTVVLLSIVCIFFYKLYLNSSKTRIITMKNRCPKCGAMNDEYSSKCYNCGYDFLKFPKVVSYYEPSSATVLTAPYSSLVDKFGDPEEKKRKNELIDDELSASILDSFLRWGYLEYIGGKYGFTDMGKNGYYRNLEFWEKKPKKRKKKQEE